ncbi:beta-phosphoglucomutase [Cohnella lubricantis]|uniref:Beta-phosphoglucomutase n=1 Tax=Cohnella lubricantis TaxID=2163172 RepID=A0A841T9E0_9BACL|nr:beta-phosphoglucomutase [Cohnella lubricantis]MBB6676656.1 beta-phosphoglucomutase [Cohnella lubricantis]MBP2120426.1 alpha,alpha-trehalose phosphorylase [Cohnella lubricantis]
MRTGDRIYPLEPWTITERSFDTETNQRDETVFAVGNGYIGIRGNFEEGYDGPPETTLHGTYLNGFYDSSPIAYSKGRHYGHPELHQTMLNVTDGKIIELYVDGEKFSLFTGKHEDYERRLDMRRGTMTRSAVWEAPSGKRVRVRIERFAAFTNKHLALVRYEATPLNFSGDMELVSAIEGKVANQVAAHDPRAGSAFRGQVLETKAACEHPEETFGMLLQQTQMTKFELACGMEHRLNQTVRLTTRFAGQRLEKRFSVTATEGEAVVLEKYIVYYSSKDYPSSDLPELALRTLAEAKASGLEAIAEEHEAFLDEFWKTADVSVEGDEALQQALRFNAYHLLQSVGRDGRTNIGAKGITGEGYDGHYFWDTETYMLPFFLYTKPDIAKRLLLYRHHILPKARARAAEMSQAGALFAWRTIDGEETSAYYAASTAQYHINADIVYALKKYVEATGDKEFLYGPGAEILFETSRFFADAGDWIEGRGFCINGVTGPDEYTTVIDNNTYTNVMVKDQLEYAADVAAELQRERPERWSELQSAMGVNAEEAAGWLHAAQHMYIHRDRGLIGQDDTFLTKAVWDFAGTPKEHYPLMLHYHALVINRHQVLKQADLVMALYLQGHRFSSWEKLRNYNYYEPLTTHDSSLSACIHGIVAAELGMVDKAYEYFMQTARVDLDDYHRNVKDGIHTASMAGAWLMIVQGFAGMRQTDGELSFRPELPRHWSAYTFRMRFRGSLLTVRVERERTTYELAEGTPIELVHLGKRVTVGLTGVTLPNRVPEAVIFDLDGVLTDTAEFHYQAWKELADELGIPFDRKINERLKGVDRLTSLKIILERADREYGQEEKEVLMARKNARYQELIGAIRPEHLLPGIPQLLEELRRSGIRMAVASASRNAPAIVGSLGIGGYFGHVVDAGALERGKPDSEVFLKAAEALGVPPKNCIGLEDSAAGLAAIRDANMLAIGIGEPSILEAADYVAASTEELNWELLQEKFGRQ